MTDDEFGQEPGDRRRGGIGRDGGVVGHQ